MAARTINEIFEALKVDYTNNSTICSFYNIPTATSFDSAFSLVSFERALLYIISVWIWSLEKNIDSLSIQVDNAVAKSRRWSLNMMVEDAKNFQLGDQLEWLDGDYKYAIENPSLKIVNLASATDNGSSITMKVAKQTGTNLPIPLTNSELTAFSIYMQQLKAPGVDLQIVSRSADTLKIYLRCYVNPLVIDLAGALVANPTIKPVEDAVKNYCYQGIDFAGKFSVTELLDSLQSVNGVVSPIFVSGEAKYGVLPYSSFEDYYTPFAGYLDIDPLFPLSLTIEYLIAP